MKIVFLDTDVVSVDISLTPIEALGELTCYGTTTPDEIPSRVADCEALIINKVKIGKPQIDAAPRLKLICEAATGVDNVDVTYAESKGIKVKNVAAYSTDSVVQTTFYHLLNLVFHCGHFDSYVKDGRYSASGLFTDLSHQIMELAGKTYGIIGMGNIGSKVAQAATAFGMKVCYYSTSGTNHCCEYPPLPLEELLACCDVVSIHAPLNERTNALIGYRELSMMKKTAYLINMGRGQIVVDNDLARAIDEGLIAGAGLDVFAPEPLSSNNPLLNIANLQKLSLTPHIAWASVEARQRLVEGIAENILSLRTQEK